MRKPGTGLPVSIAGTVQYEDRTLNASGFTGTTSKPVRKAIVEVVREADGSMLASGATGLNGSYSLTFTNTGASGVYVRVLAQDSDNRVVVRSTNAALYAIRSLIIDDTAATSFIVDLTVTVDAKSGVFNILDVFLEAAEFVANLTGAPPPPVIGIWSSGSCDGTYFNPADNTIHILGGGSNACPDFFGDTDEHDDPVLLHEYGHFIAAHYSKDDSPGGSHFLSDNTQDIRLSWSEGWGNFFAGAVRGDPLYVDTQGTVASIALEIEGLTSPMVTDLSSLALYITNELSVAAVLWDIFDATPDEAFTNVIGTDAISAGMVPIWDVVASYLTCTTCGITNVSFEDFWDGWFNCTVCATVNQGSQTEMKTVVGDRKMALTTGSFEPDDTVADATAITVNGAAQTHTLYPVGDVDYVSFTSLANATHTVETLELTNGADTMIEIYDSQTAPTPIASNDNWDNKTYGPCGVNFFTQQSNCPPNGVDPSTGREPLSSRVQFAANNGTTYYIRVTHSPAAPPSAGIYGEYQIRITFP